MTSRPTSLLVHAALRVLPLAVAVLAITWTATSHYWEATSTARLDSRLQREAEYAAETLSVRLATLMQAVQAVASNDLTVNGLIDTQSRSAYLPTFLRSLKLPGPIGASITMTDYRGRYIAGKGEAQSFAGTDWFQAALDGEATLEFSATLARITVPIRYQGSAEGLIAVEYRGDDVRALLALRSGTGEIAVLDADGQPLFSSAGDFIPDSVAGVARTDEWTYTTRPVTGSPGLSAAVGLRTADATAVVHSFRRALAIGLLVALAGTLAAILISARVAVAPISRMVEQIRSIRGADHLDTRLRVEGPIEVRALARAFNDSAEALEAETRERRQRESELEALARRNAMLAGAIAATTSGVTISDPRQPENPLIYCNDAFCTMTGYSREEALGRNCRFLRGADTSDAAVEQIRASLAEREPATLEILNYRKDGSPFWNLLTIFPVYDAHGELINFVGTQQDITAMKQAEEARLEMERELRHAQKLEALGTLAGGIAHEINTPIQYIGDNLRFLEEAASGLLRMVDSHEDLYQAAAEHDLLESQLAACRSAREECDVEFLREEAINATRDSLEGVRQVSNIVQAMKEFSHPSTRELAPVDINRVVERTAVVCKSEWKHVAEMIFELDEKLPEVPGLHGPLNQVALNLIVNAAHAIAARGEERGRITIRTRRDGASVRMEVEDTGTGMPPHLVERIFEPFFTTKEVGRGTGQGLALAHDIIVKKHAGRIDVRSIEGQGTTFIVTLPVGDPVQRAA